MYKIAIYAICKDEVQNVDAWIKSMKEADYICILDTGSSDGTYEKLQDWARQYPNQIFVERHIFEVWDFADARNYNMKQIPADTDICMCTDLDERLILGWADKVRNMWTNGATEGQYLYAWKHDESGNPSRTFWYNKIHSFNEWIWKFPVHEALVYQGARPEHAVSCGEILLHHYPDLSKNRSNYLPLLELRTQKHPEDTSGWVYLLSELYFHGRFEDAILRGKMEVLPHIAEDNCYTAFAYRTMGLCAKEMGNFKEAEKFFKTSILYDPECRSSYLCLGYVYLDLEQPEEAIDVVTTALTYTFCRHRWYEEEGDWTSKPWDILALAYFALDKLETSLQYAKFASLEDPQNTRLTYNIETIQKILLEKGK